MENSPTVEDDSGYGVDHMLLYYFSSFITLLARTFLEHNISVS